MLPGGAWTLGAAIVLLVVAAAKAHGRQVRLERERIGVHEVRFGKANDPRVEAIWRRDRRGFWALFAVLATAAWALPAIGLRVAGTGAYASAALLLALAFGLCFVVLGLVSLAEARGLARFARLVAARGGGARAGRLVTVAARPTPAGGGAAARGIRQANERERKGRGTERRLSRGGTRSRP